MFTSTTNYQHIEEVRAEEHFISTVKRGGDGKFVVRLLVNDKISLLGDARTMAQKRFYNLEKRFAKDADLAKQYDMFISEYLKLKHMELARPNQNTICLIIQYSRPTVPQLSSGLYLMVQPKVSLA